MHLTTRCTPITVKKGKKSSKLAARSICSRTGRGLFSHQRPNVNPSSGRWPAGSQPRSRTNSWSLQEANPTKSTMRRKAHLMICDLARYGRWGSLWTITAAKPAQINPSSSLTTPTLGHLPGKKLLCHELCKRRRCVASLRCRCIKDGATTSQEEAS